MGCLAASLASAHSIPVALVPSHDHQKYLQILPNVLWGIAIAPSRRPRLNYLKLAVASGMKAEVAVCPFQDRTLRDATCFRLSSRTSAIPLEDHAWSSPPPPPGRAHVHRSKLGPHLRLVPHPAKLGLDRGPPGSYSTDT